MKRTTSPLVYLFIGLVLGMVAIVLVGNVAGGHYVIEAKKLHQGMTYTVTAVTNDVATIQSDEYALIWASRVINVSHVDVFKLGDYASGIHFTVREGKGPVSITDVTAEDLQSVQ